MAIEGEVVDFGGNPLIVVIVVVVTQSVELGVLQRNGSDDSVVAMNLVTGSRGTDCTVTYCSCCLRCLVLLEDLHLAPWCCCYMCVGRHTLCCDTHDVAHGLTTSVSLTHRATTTNSVIVVTSLLVCV